MRKSDLFRDRKGVHIKLKKEIHAEFRKKLFEQGISMQRVFNEFARLVAADDSRAMGIVRRLVQREADEELRKLEQAKRHEEPLDDLDRETLYDLIEGVQGEQDDHHAETS